MLVRVHGCLTTLKIQDYQRYSHWIYLNRRSKKRNLLAMQIMKKAKLVDFESYGWVRFEISREDYEKLEILEAVDFRRVKKLRSDSKAFEELKVYAAAETLGS